jgi:hypothetical protein
MLLLDDSLHRWLEDHGPQLTLLVFWTTPGARVALPSSFPPQILTSIFWLLVTLLRRYVISVSFNGVKHDVLVRNDDHWGRSKIDSQGNASLISSAALLRKLGDTYIPANSPQAKGSSERLWGTFKHALPVNCAWLASPICPPPARSSAVSATTIDNRRFGCAP